MDMLYLAARIAQVPLCFGAALLGLVAARRAARGQRATLLAGAALLALAGVTAAHDGWDNVVQRADEPLLLGNWLWLALDLLVPGWFVAMLRAMQARDAALARVAQMAVTDALTGLPNRRGFFERAGAVLAEARRKRAPAALLALDLDRFKSINDGWGHAAGDAVLRGFAAILKDTSRAGDIPGRTGGEEFVLLLPGTTLQDAMVLAGRLGAAVAAGVPHPDGTARQVTVSIGVAPVADSLEAAMAAADAALYAAKRGGRNRAVAAGAAPAAEPALTPPPDPR